MRPRTLATYAIAVAVTACIPLPIPHNEQVTPYAAGVLRRADGSPVAAVPVAVTRHSHDTLCARPAIRRSTDSTGRFVLPATEAHRSIFWLTMMENLGMTHYWLCAGSSDSADGPEYRRRTYISGRMSGDSLDCLEWVWLVKHVTCNTAGARRVVTGGAWTDGRIGGTYRLILAEDEVWGYKFRGFVQWIESSARGAPVIVRTTSEVPAGAGIADGDAWLEQWNGHWCVIAQSTVPTKWGTTKWQTFVLGPPGDITQVPDSLAPKRKHLRSR